MPDFWDMLALSGDDFDEEEFKKLKDFINKLASRVSSLEAKVAELEGLKGANK